MTLTGEDTDLEYKMEGSLSDEDEAEMHFLTEERTDRGRHHHQQQLHHNHHHHHHHSHHHHHEQQRQQEQETSDIEHAMSKRMAHFLAIYQKKVQDSKRVIVRLKQQKDLQLQSVINQLLVLEAQLRREQKGIIGQLVQRDNVIAAQRQEIDRLRRDNRRLINKLKKFSEMCEKAGKVEHAEPRIKVSRIESPENQTSPSKSQSNSSATSSPMSRKAKSGMIRVATSISELISSNNDGSLLKPHESHSHMVVGSNSSSSSNSHHSTEYVNPNVASVRATTNRVFHKPPIAEKPKGLNRVVQVHPNSSSKNCQQVFVSSGEKECSIVSTISRLLEEESDATNTGGSGGSESSSPEATLKPVTPRVIRLARQFEEGLNNHNISLLSYENAANSSPELMRSEEQTSKSYIMDEYEVTSGYNSDSISDHEYENIRVGNKENNTSLTKYDSKTENKDDENEEDNYVILRAVREEHTNGNWIDIPEDQHIYSNVEFGSGLMVKNIDSDGDDGDMTIRSHSESPKDSPSSTPQKKEKGVLETNLDTSSSSDHMMSESMRVAANVPRSRQNINLIMERDGDHMTENFEEFTLDSLELEEEHSNEGLDDQGKENLPVSEQRKCGDGAEAKMNNKNKEDTSGTNSDGKESSNVPINGHYEKFLEATGLSQKSILTPTRMFSNHRSMLKPRDIKHRDKLRTTFTSHSSLEDSQNSSGSYKYWTEPYL